MKAKVHILPDNRILNVDSPKNLLEVCSMAGLMLDASCGGNGTCGHCKVQIISGEAGEVTAQEKKLFSAREIEEGWRLACQMMVIGDLTIRIPDLPGSSERKRDLNQLPEGFLDDIILQNETTDNEINHSDTHAIDTNNMEVTNHFDTTSSNGDKDSYGIAFDMGTTTLVGILWNLSKAIQIDAEAATNPQTVHGADVISRIQYAMEGEDHRQALINEIRQSLISMTKTLCDRNAIDTKKIQRITLVGNTTMCHLFLGKDPSGLARYPFTPAYQGGYTFDPLAYGLPLDAKAQACLLPGIAGHVGADITALMLACDLNHTPEDANVMAIDIGTNGEILLASQGRILACSTAAGPAFEGASIICGMRAAKGAIESCKIEADLTYQTIDGVPARGICGSGLIDLISEMLSCGLILENGNLLTREQAMAQGLPSSLCARLYGEGPEKGFFICHNEGFDDIVLSRNEESDDIVLTQKDIREVQLAKGAILGGMKTMLKKLDLTTNDIDILYLAGAFGSYIDKRSAIRIGLLPPIQEEKIKSVGNAAGSGASMVLLKPELMAVIEEGVAKIEHMELSQEVDFQSHYFESMNF